MRKVRKVRRIFRQPLYGIRALREIRGSKETTGNAAQWRPVGGLEIAFRKIATRYFLCREAEADRPELETACRKGRRTPGFAPLTVEMNGSPKAPGGDLYHNNVVSRDTLIGDLARHSL